MDLKVTREMISAFLLNTLPMEKMSLVADAILSNERLGKIYNEEKLKYDARRYRDNKLDSSQQIEFEFELKKRLELIKDFNQQREIDNLSEDNLLKLQLEEAYNNHIAYQEQKSSTRQTHTIGMNIKYWLVAASITALTILGGGAIFFFQNGDSIENKLYAEYYSPLSKHNFYLFNNSSLAIAKQKYMDGDYTNAILLLKDLPSYVTIEAEKNLFIGLSLIEIGEYKGAIDYFEEVLNAQKKHEYIQQVRWYLGLCYLKVGDRRKAIDTFRSIADNNGYNYKEAKQILKKLRD
ncbi:MAG: tetratricopeptide repeat protein [Bacteroidales bacterium]|nr:tetratricopeptide repeat protein [Bacteroidales bacterium]